MRQAAWLTSLAMLSVALLPTVLLAQGPIPETTAARYGLSRKWFAQIGSAQVTGRVRHVNYVDGMLLIQSSVGMLTALDAETGRTLWQTRVGHTEGGSSVPAANDDYVVVLNGSTLHVVSRKDGHIAWKKRTSGAPGAGPGITATHAFVPLVSGLVEGYDLEAGAAQTPWNYKSTGRILTRPLTTPLSVSWTTDAGYFYVADPSAGGIKYRLESRGAMHARPASWPPLLFATSVDGFVYGIEETRGEIIWKHSLGVPIYEQPVAVTDRVYAILEFGGLVCLSADDGALQWQTPGIMQFVAASPTRVYAVDTVGRLAIIDATSGAKLGSLPTTGDMTFVVNSDSDRIFVVNDNCLVQCLHEPHLNAPAMHNRPKPNPEADLNLKPGKPGAAPSGGEAPTPTPADEMPEPAADGNPFGLPPGDAPMDDNPFAPPAGGAAPADDNPFGAPSDAAAGDNPFAP